MTRRKDQSQPQRFVKMDTAHYLQQMQNAADLMRRMRQETIDHYKSLGYEITEIDDMIIVEKKT